MSGHSKIDGRLRAALLWGVALGMGSLACGSRTSDDNDGGADAPGDGDGFDGTSGASDLPKPSLDDACAAQTSWMDCLDTSEDYKNSLGDCSVPGLEGRGCGCQWIEEMSLGSDLNECAVKSRNSYCRSFSTMVGFGNDCLDGDVVGECPATIIGYQVSNDPSLAAIGVVAIWGCNSPDTGTGTPYNLCLNEPNSPTCQCLMAEAEKICM